MAVIGIASLVLIASFWLQTANSQESLRLETTSNEGTFLIIIDWEPNEIGRDNTFTIVFIEPETESLLEDIKYDLRVLHADSGEQVLRRVDQVSAVQTIGFDAPGPYTLNIEDIEGLGEDASVTFQVTPEFPAGAIVLAAGMIVAVFLVRSRRDTLFSHWANNQ